MKKRTLDEMISYFNQQVSEMDIKHEDRIKLLGMITAIGYESKKQERKTGRWKDYIGKDLGIEGAWLRDDGKTVFLQCDQCDSLYVRNFMIHANYCPNCGAKMEVEHEIN